MPRYDTGLLEVGPRRKRRLGALPASVLNAAYRRIDRIRDPEQTALTVEILCEAHPAARTPYAQDWTLRFLCAGEVAGFAQISEFVAPGPTLDLALFQAMDAHSADACALYLLLRRHFAPDLPALGSLAHLATVQILPGRMSGALWVAGFERALARIPWRRTPAVLVGLPYPLEYLCPPDLTQSKAFQGRTAALLRFYERRMGFVRLRDREDTWIWRTQNLQARAADGAGMLLRREEAESDGGL